MSYSTPPPPSLPSHMHLNRYQISSYDSSTLPPPPPPPPPKAPSHEPSQRSTPLPSEDGMPPPLPPPPPSTNSQPRHQIEPQGSLTQAPEVSTPEAWLPDTLKDQSLSDLQTIHQNPELKEALVFALSTTHPSYPASLQPVDDLLAQNIALAQQILTFSAQLAQQRQNTESQLLRCHALERQWRQKQSALDDALAPWSHRALHQRLVGSISEQNVLTQALEDSFVEGEGKATEREVGEFVKRYREGRKTYWVRRERRERWDEGRVGGWR